MFIDSLNNDQWYTIYTGTNDENDDEADGNDRYLSLLRQLSHAPSISDGEFLAQLGRVDVAAAVRVEELKGPAHLVVHLRRRRSGTHVRR